MCVSTGVYVCTKVCVCVCVRAHARERDGGGGGCLYVCLSSQMIKKKLSCTLLSILDWEMWVGGDERFFLLLFIVTINVVCVLNMILINAFLALIKLFPLEAGVQML